MIDVYDMKKTTKAIVYFFIKNLSAMKFIIKLFIFSLLVTFAHNIDIQHNLIQNKYYKTERVPDYKHNLKMHPKIYAYYDGRTRKAA